MQGHDADWQAHTSGKVNGQDVNSAQYAYVVMSKDQMAASGVSLGDWALVTNNSTGQNTCGRHQSTDRAGEGVLQGPARIARPCDGQRFQ